MPTLPRDLSGNVVQIFQPTPGLIGLNTAATVNTETTPVFCSHCHSDGQLTYTVDGNDYAATHVEGQQWGIPVGTTVITVNSGTFSFM